MKIIVYWRLFGFLVLLLVVGNAIEEGGWPLFFVCLMAALIVLAAFVPKDEPAAVTASPRKSGSKRKQPPASRQNVSQLPRPAVPAGVSGNSISEALDSLSPWLLERSGSLFYTGKEAFSGRQKLYLLGLNPGGDPIDQESETVGRALTEFRRRSSPWSAYLDDSWQGAAPGTWGMQPRVLHLLRNLGCDPRLTPASNVVFPRTRNEAELRLEKDWLLEMCWPVHQAVINSLDIRVILCFGATAGKWVREQTGAHQQIAEFREQNARGWKSEAHEAFNGRAVITVTHPGRADWRTPAADPTPLVKRVLQGR
ncbi:hypothetical protein SAMN02927924_02692 [Sphingobium faniae]|nr:hypothetical protein SAMN02927924_02692 [Sphingobium faniae]